MPLRIQIQYFRNVRTWSERRGSHLFKKDDGPSYNTSTHMEAHLLPMTRCYGVSPPPTRPKTNPHTHYTPSIFRSPDWLAKGASCSTASWHAAVTRRKTPRRSSANWRRRWDSATRRASCTGSPLLSSTIAINRLWRCMCFLCTIYYKRVYIHRAAFFFASAHGWIRANSSSLAIITTITILVGIVLIRTATPMRCVGCEDMAVVPTAGVILPTEETERCGL